MAVSQGRAPSEGKGDAERKARGGRSSGGTERDSESRGGPLWADLATGAAGVGDRIQRSCACGGGGAACPGCAEDEEEAAVQRKADCSCGGSCGGCRERSDSGDGSGTRPSLTLGAPDDRYEREAEAVASEVLRMPAEGLPVARSTVSVSRADEPRDVHRVQRCPTCGAGALEALPAAAPSGVLVQRACAKCARAREGEEGSGRDSPGSPAGGTRMDRVRRLIASPGPGAPVPREVRAPTERVLGADLSGVRVHANARSGAAARDIGARAFTHGAHIFLGAGQSRGDPGLMAHELTHTVQQGASPPRRDSPGGSTVGPGPARPDGASGPPAVQRIGIPFVDLPSGEEVLEAGEAAYDWGSEKAGAAYDWGAEKAEAAYERGSELAGAAYERGSELAGAAYEWGSERAREAYETGSKAAEWAWERGGELARGAYRRVRGVAEDVWDTARSLAEALDGAVSVTGDGVEVNVPTICPESSLSRTFLLDPMEKEFMVPAAALPLGGTFSAVGKVGVVGRLQPRVGVQAGPFCLRGMRIVMNPLTGAASIRGSVTAPAAVSLGAEVRGGLRGAVSVDGVIPIGEIPVPISIPVVGVEGGVAGMLQGIGAGTLSMSGGASMSGGLITVSQSGTLDVGVAGDLFLGAYGQLDVLGQNVCRLYWQPFERHADIAGSVGFSATATVGLGTRPSLSATIHRPTFSRIPFDDIPLALSREGFSEDCPLRDRICWVMRTLELLPSQQGGSWGWSPSHPYGPGRRLPPDSGPLTVFEKAPARVSGAECRGACGPDCDTCEQEVACRYTDPETGDVWWYTNFQHCKSHEGCREHDAGFDWAAAEKGETGGMEVVVYPWHMAANIECACNNLAGNCVAWIAGLPPYDMDMFFAEFATRVPTTDGAIPSEIAELPPCRPPEEEREGGGAAEAEPEDEEEAVEEEGEGGRTVVEDPLTAESARNLPDLEGELDDPDHYASTLTLVGGTSGVVGRVMLSDYITDDTAMGSEPHAQEELYGYGRLPKRGDMRQSGYSSDYYFVRGHLLNHNDERGLGGEGEAYNLFPITARANGVHNREVEEDVKSLVHDAHVVVRYRVVVGNVEGPYRFDAFEDDPGRECVYEFVNADFLCEYATYRLYSDDTVEPNEPETYTVDEDFDVEGFKEHMEGDEDEEPCPGKG